MAMAHIVLLSSCRNACPSSFEVFSHHLLSGRCQTHNWESVFLLCSVVCVRGCEKENSSGHSVWQAQSRGVNKRAWSRGEQRRNETSLEGWSDLAPPWATPPRSRCDSRLHATTPSFVNTAKNCDAYDLRQGGMREEMTNAQPRARS